MKLFINEFIKDYKKKSTIIYVFLLLIMMSVKSFLIYYDATSITKVTPKMEYIIFESLKASLWLSSIFVLIMLANNITQEYSKGTAKFLYSKPKARSSILTAKLFLSLNNYFLFSVIAFCYDVAFNKYVLYKNSIYLRKIIYSSMEEGYFKRLLWEQLGFYFLSFSALMLFLISLTTIICILFKNQILSVIVVLFMLVSKNLIDLFVGFATVKFEYIKYIFTNISNIPYYFESEVGRKSVEEITKLNSTSLLLMLLSYTVLFTIISYIVHARRDIILD